jgi:hypothetical protein
MPGGCTRAGEGDLGGETSDEIAWPSNHNAPSAAMPRRSGRRWRRRIFHRLRQGQQQAIGQGRCGDHEDDQQHQHDIDQGGDIDLGDG